MRRGNEGNEDRMNTKMNSTPPSGVHRNVGRQVGVLPLPSRPRIQNAGTSGRRRPPGLGRRNSGASSSSSSKKQPATVDDSDEEFDVNLCLKDKPLSSRSTSSPSLPGSSRSSARSVALPGGGRSRAPSTASALSSARSIPLESSLTDTPPSERKVIPPAEILERCQEQDYYKVFEIDLHGLDLTEIGDIDKFKKVRILDVSCNHIRTIDGLEFAKELKELKLYDNKIKTVENLQNLRDLNTLQLQYNQIRSVGRGLKEQKKLKILRLDFNQISRLETIEMVPLAQLTHLNISNNRIEDLSALTYLPCLEELSAGGNLLRKLAPLQACKRLSEVDLSHNRLADLSGLANLHNLQTLDVSSNQLSAMKSVGRLRSLEELNANKNRLASLSEMKDLFPRLQILYVEDNRISAWSEVVGLKEVPELMELNVAGNPFCQEGGEKFHYLQEIQTTLPNLEMVDGANFRKVTARPSGTPLMRPMTASGAISLRQVETQIVKEMSDLEAFERTMLEKFESVRGLVERLPQSSPDDTFRNEEGTSRPPSKTSSRLRIREAQEFAAQHFE